MNKTSIYEQVIIIIIKQFDQLFKIADSFKKETSDCLMSESLNHSFNELFRNFESFRN